MDWLITVYRWQDSPFFFTRTLHPPRSGLLEFGIQYWKSHRGSRACVE